MPIDTVLHSAQTGTDLHVPGYLGSSDPGAVGAGKYWIDTTGGTGVWALKVRNAANTGWETIGSGGGGGVTDATYLVGAAHAGLSAEIVVGATPGGELGGTWASPTVDSSHSGSTHAATQSAAETTASGALSTHAGAADPHTGYRLESADHSHASTGLQAGQVAHSALTGLTTGDDHTQYQKESEKGVASGYASLDSGVLVPVAQLGSGTPTGLKFLRDDRTWQVPAGGGGLTDHTHAVTGSGATGGGAALAPTSLILPGSAAPSATAEGAIEWDTGDNYLGVGNGSSTTLFGSLDSTAPSTQDFGDAAAAGSTVRSAHRDHVHGMPANPVIGLVSTLNFLIDGGGAVISTGIKGDLVVDFACTITKWTVLADVSGSIAVAIWKDSYANFPPVVGDLLVTPTISGATKAQTGSLSHALAAGDVLRFNVNSAATITKATIALTVSRT